MTDEQHYKEVTIEVKDKVTGDIIRVTFPHVATWKMDSHDPDEDFISLSLLDRIFEISPRLTRAEVVLLFDARLQGDQKYVYEMRMIKNDD